MPKSPLVTKKIKIPKINIRPYDWIVEHDDRRFQVLVAYSDGEISDLYVKEEGHRDVVGGAVRIKNTRDLVERVWALVADLAVGEVPA